MPYLVSALMHAAVVALLIFFYYTLTQQRPVRPRVMELVAGVGNNYGARVAPALGNQGAVKLKVPAPKAEVPAPPQPQPAQPEAAPVTPTPPTATPKPVETKAPNFAGAIRRQVMRADLRAKAAVAKERAEEQKRITKEEFDRANKARAAEKGTPPKIAKIDGAGIAKGVANGSTDNTEGGAGGKALVRDDGSLLDAYFTLLRQRLQEALERPAGLSDSLVATAQFRIAADGTLSSVRIIKPSGSAEFDDAVRSAFRHVRPIGPHPEGKSEVVELDFRMRETDGG